MDGRDVAPLPIEPCQDRGSDPARSRLQRRPHRYVKTKTGGPTFDEDTKRAAARSLKSRGAAT